jgi:hypothetical protein
MSIGQGKNFRAHQHTQAAMVRRNSENVEKMQQRIDRKADAARQLIVANRLSADERTMTLLKRLAWYYEINDCQERPRDMLGVPNRDLLEALKLVRIAGLSPEP